MQELKAPAVKAGEAVFRMGVSRVKKATAEKSTGSFADIWKVGVRQQLIYQAPAYSTDLLTTLLLLQVARQKAAEADASADSHLYEQIRTAGKNDEFGIENDECCIKTDEFCIKTDEFCIKRFAAQAAQAAPRVVP